MKVTRIAVATFLFIFGTAILSPMCLQYPSFVIIVLFLGINFGMQFGGK